jgi:hypothetical protein
VRKQIAILALTFSRFCTLLLLDGMAICFCGSRRTTSRLQQQTCTRSALTWLELYYVADREDSQDHRCQSGGRWKAAPKIREGWIPDYISGLYCPPQGTALRSKNYPDSA